MFCLKSKFTVFSFLYTLRLVGGKRKGTTSRSIIIYQRSIVFRQVAFLYTLWSVDNNWTVDLNLLCSQFFSRKVVFSPSDIVHERPIVFHLAHQRRTFFISVTWFFFERYVNLIFCRLKNSTQSSILNNILELTGIHKVRRYWHKALQEYHTIPADVLPNDSEAL